jgi:hypothetical protein
MTPSSALARLLVRAAELRAGGTAWEMVAATVGRSVATCRRWPRKYPDLWRRAYGAAMRENLAGGGAEGLRMLRSLLRLKDEKIRRDAAKALATLLVRARRSRRSGRPAAEADPLTAVAQVLTDDQLRALVAAAEIMPALGDGLAPGGGTGSPQSE